MSICKVHRERLQAALQKRDLWRLVKPERAKELANRWLSGEMRNEGDFDPYVVCWLEIHAHAVELLRDFGPKSRACSLCEVERQTRRGIADQWIDRFADLVWALAVKMGLAKPPQSGRSFISEAHLH